MILPPRGKILVELIDSDSEMIGEFVAGILETHDGSQVLPGTKLVISDHGGESFEYLGKCFVVCTQNDVLGIIKENQEVQAIRRVDG